MHHLLIVLAALLVCATASATELVRVRVSQFDGSEPAALSSTSHPDLFVLDPSIASAELVATNPADPRKENYGPATWFPEVTPRQGLPLEFGSIELRITPVSGQPVVLGALHFRTEALVAGRPAGFTLTGPGVEPPIQPPGTRYEPYLPPVAGPLISLADGTTATLRLDATISDEVATFRWSTEANFTGTPGGPAGFRDVDIVVITPLCEPAPPTDCEATTSARTRLVERGRARRLAWSWRALGVAFEPLGGSDAAPLFAWCVYDGDRLRTSVVLGPDVCGERSCWRERRRGFLYRDAYARLRLRQTARGVAGAIEAVGPAYAIPIPRNGTPPSDEHRSQLVRSDDGACFESSFSLP